MAIAQDRHGRDVEHLNSFLRGEMSAVETYQLALRKLAPDTIAREQLESCLMSHEQRVDLLRMKIRERGGQPAESSGAWGAFAKVFESGASVLGDKVAIAALEEGEDHGLKDYRADVAALDTEAQQLVKSQLIPEQVQTYEALTRLKSQMH